MKKVIVGFLAFFLIAGTAYAAGNSNIVKVLVNGKPVQDGQLIDGSTMLPLRAIGEALGVTVDWDNTKKQASITAPQKPVQDGLTLAQLNKIGESVGLVYAVDQNGLLGTGSGFVIDNIFVTNWHVAKDAQGIQVWFGNKSEEIPLKAAVFKDEDADLIGFPIYGYPSVTLNVMTPSKGDKVYEMGYPHRKFQIFDGEFQFMSAANTLYITAKSDHGDSGGIVINAEGEVIGVMVGINEGTTGGHAIPAQVLLSELNKL